jgi:hypothetical protein
MKRREHALPQSGGGGRVNHVRAIAAVDAAGWDPAVLRREQLNDKDMGPILEDIGTGQHPEWKDIAEHRSTYKSHCAQWKSINMRNCILNRK